MKHVLTILAITLIATSALAASEKAVDLVDARPGAASRIVISGTLDANSAIYNRAYYNATPADPDCAYPVLDSSLDGQSYTTFCISSTDANPIEVIVDASGTTIGDTFMALYCAFDPADPLSNAVFTDDDDGDGLFSAFTVNDNLVLPAGTEYTLVVTTFSAGDLGDFLINTSDNVAFCGSVPAENHSWSDLKGLYR
jgi:hypothetical protein